jgi:hypothetical protein
VGVHSTCIACPLVFALQTVSINLSGRSKFVRRDGGGGERKHKQFSLEEKCKILEEIREQRCQAEREQEMETAHQFSLDH